MFTVVDDHVVIKVAADKCAGRKKIISGWLISCLLSIVVNYPIIVQYSPYIKSSYYVVNHKPQPPRRYSISRIISRISHISWAGLNATPIFYFDQLYVTLN